MGEQIPTRWLQFENDLNRLKKQQDNFYASLDQVKMNENFFLFLILLISFFCRFVKSLVHKIFVRLMNLKLY
jgi:hypothetical protein